MAELKKYSNFKSLKSEEKTGYQKVRDNAFTEFEAFLKRLQVEYSIKKKAKTDHGNRANG